MKNILKILILILSLIVCLQSSRLYKLEHEKKEFIATETVLEECPFCGGSPKLVTSGDVFCIKCEECKMRTDFFTSKYNLVNYWNKRKSNQ